MPATRRHRITILGPAVIALALGAGILLELRRAGETALQLAQARTVVQALDAIEARLTNAETSVRGFVITGDTTYLPQYRAARTETDAAVMQLGRMPSEHMTPQQLDSLSKLVWRRFVILDSGVALGPTSRQLTRPISPPVSQPGRAVMRATRGIIATMRAEEVAFLENERATERVRRRAVSWIVGIGSIITALLALAANSFLHRVALEQEQTAEERESLVRALDTANRAKAEFLARTSHDLRAPLNAIEGFTDLLMLGSYGPLQDEQKRALERIRSSGRYLLGLIDDILSFAKLEAGQIEIRADPLPLGPMLAAVEPVVARQLSDKHLTYRCAPVDPRLMVTADEARFHQIMLNLVTNAIKFTDGGGTIAVGCASDDSIVTVRVSDTGCGIASDRLQSIFEPFVQIDPQARRPGRDGLGLGLAISRDLARRMGGDVTVESREGVGSVFEITVPRVGPAAPLAPPERPIHMPIAVGTVEA
jgi:signal transduction histidine kinase